MIYTLSVASVRGYLEYEDAWSEGFISASASGDGKIVIFTPQVSTHTCAKFLSRSREFYKNGDKFGWVKYWQMTFNSPNSPKSSPTTILHYMVYSAHQAEKSINSD